MAKRDVAQEVTDSFIAQLEAGTVPWRKPWSADGVMPRNRWTGRPYRGINALLTAMSAQAHGYESSQWTTYRAAQAHGGQVRKGEKSTAVVLWKPLQIEEDGKPKTIFMTRLYYVFNTDQCDGVEATRVEREPVTVPDALAAIIDGYRGAPPITYAAQDDAYYHPVTDSIHLPLLTQFGSTEGYAETVLHELTHSTGHHSRLDRFGKGYSGHGRAEYAREELVAEIGASMLMGHAGIKCNMPAMAEYVRGWLTALQNDKSLIIKAAGLAQKASDHILGVSVAASTESE